MSLFTFKLPDIGEGIAECEIATWRVAVGDVVKEDQPLVDMLTDKAAVARANGVGPKLALRIVTELKGKPLGDVSFAPTAPGVHLEVAPPPP